MAVEGLMVSGLIHERADASFETTEAGGREFAELGKFAQFERRLPFLRGVTDSLLVLPIGIIRHATLSNPEVSHAEKLGATRWLLDGPALAEMHEHLGALSEMVGVAASDLMIPTVVWLRYLQAMGAAAERADGH